jgi:multimeric flavodoxin WrbA
MYSSSTFGTGRCRWEHRGTIGDFADPTYSDPIVRRWNRKIEEADAVLVVTAEYLHSISGVLKNALDSIFVSLCATEQADGHRGLQRGHRRRRAGP